MVLGQASVPVANGLHVFLFVLCFPSSCSSFNFNIVVIVVTTVPGGPPLNFSAKGISSTSVRLSWNEPEKRLRNGDIIMYEISYYRTSDPTETYDLNTTDTSIAIEGLDMNSDYLFQIKAYTSKGAGQWSSRLPFRTFGQRKFLFCLLSYYSSLFVLCRENSRMSLDVQFFRHFLPFG